MRAGLFIWIAQIVALDCLSDAKDINERFELYKIRHGKVYESPEENDRRMEIFSKNLKIIERHNAEMALGLHSFTLGENRFADLTHEEFLSKFSAPKMIKRASNHESKVTFNVSDLPQAVDWRQEGYVTPVKDQGQCGSCWTFSATGSMEGAHKKSTGTLVSLSEQNLMDCVHPYEDGCNGGAMLDAFDYVVENGIMSEADYPYMAKDSGYGVCNYINDQVVATMRTYKSIIPYQDEEQLMQALAMVGPISIGIDASQVSFQLYHDGVYSEPSCSSTKLDHGVLAVGYGIYGIPGFEGQDYWLVKNSWGSSWGMDGYVMIARNQGNMCGVATDASYPIA